jgi:hypothetical protein
VKETKTSRVVALVKKIRPIYLYFDFWKIEIKSSLHGIATGYWLDDQGGECSSSGRVKMFTSPYRPDRLWGPPNLL